MAKILVADDNSNIQKMVGLALKDQGIEVIGVGNGEAAVRKISDVHPDLVLADVFMPVRNGYEVCSYVKADTALAHIPVILLVGAFDPLDEQEAQRVGADGVLKKPFVPPDPLISMVKSALARAASAPAPRPQSAAPAAPPPPAPAEHVPAPEPVELPDIFAGAPQQVEIPKGSQALAFGNLLDVTDEEPAQKPATAEEDDSFLVTRNPRLEDQRGWGLPAAAPPAAEPAAEAESVEDTVSTSGWVPEEETSPPHTEAAGNSSYGSDLMEMETFQNKAAAPPPPAPPPPAAPPQIELETEDDFALETQAETGNLPVPQEELSPAYEFMGPPSPEIAAAVNASANAGKFGDEVEPHTEASFAESSEGWTTETQPGNPWGEQPAATREPAWQMESEAASSSLDSPLPFTEPAAPAPPALDTTAERAAAAPSPAPPASAVPISDTDATVARVLERMSPEMLQTVTRELLKPVIEALVKEELDKKK